MVAIQQEKKVRQNQLHDSCSRALPAKMQNLRILAGIGPAFRINVHAAQWFSGQVERSRSLICLANYSNEITHASKCLEYMIR
jgi:hypothetical protein